MKAGLVVGAAIATAVAVMVSCSPDRIPGSPISSAEPGVSFNAASGSGNALASSSGSLSGSLSGSTSGSISGSSGVHGSGPQGGCKSVSGSVSGSTSGSTIQPPANCGGGNDSNSDSGLHCGNNGSVTVSGSTSSAIGSSSDSRYCKDKGKGNDDR